MTVNKYLKVYSLSDGSLNYMCVTSPIHYAMLW
jgi:hypothetical protein